MNHGAEQSGVAAPPGRRLLLPFLLLVATAGSIATDALAPRDLSQGEDAAVWNANPDLLAFQLSRLITAAVLLASLTAIVARVIRQGFPRAGITLWSSFLAFVVTNYALPGLVAREPGFDYRLFLTPLVLTGAYFARPMPTERLLALAKGALLAYVYASLAAAVVLPDHALAGGFAGLIPGVDVRLYGVGGGGTSLGTISSCYLAMELAAPARSRLRSLHLAAAALALALTQAKTSWVFLLAVVLVLLYRRLPRLSLGAGPSGRAAWVLLLACGALAVVVLGAGVLGRADLGDLQGGENLATFTGRTYIWATSLRTWLESPVLGYGLGLWESERFRAQFGGFDHAHNQLLHSLASAGIVGLAGLLLYLWTAIRLAVRAVRQTAAPLALLAGMLSVCLTNVPLRNYYVLDAFAVLHLVLFALLLQAERLGRAPPPGVAATPAPGAYPSPAALR